jgi:hypothetical protein
MGYEITWETRGARKRFFDHVTDAELMRSVEDIESDPRFDSVRYVVNDFLAVASFSVSEENVLTISAIAGAASISNPNIKVAIVATDTGVLALAELYADSPLNTYPTRIFTNMDAARDWVAEVDGTPDKYATSRYLTRYRF